jgi:hypothetical protein
MFQKIISYLMTGDVCSYADELSDKISRPHNFKGEYGLGAAVGMSNPSALAENEVYSYKNDFLER